MKEIGTILVLNLVAITCFVIAGALAYNQLEGWGWFILAGFLTSTYEYNPKPKENTNND